MKRIALAAFFIVLLQAPAWAQVVFVEPPAVIYEPVPALPAPGYVWLQGHWYWNGYRWIWINGAYVYPPFPGAFWIGGEWVHTHGHRWAWRPGRWEHRR